ncbi:MAG: hypothetical protein IPQ09_15300 [Myxococcales bacterium]|nr:hypothetical protein [Myxococcales bacterium]
MGKYRARDLVNGPTLVSWLRVPLAALFPFAVGSPWASVCVLAAAGLSDVLTAGSRVVRSWPPLPARSSTA